MLPVFLHSGLMVALGMYFILMTVIGMFQRNRLLESPGYLKLMLWSISRAPRYPTGVDRDGNRPPALDRLPPDGHGRRGVADRSLPGSSEPVGFHPLYGLLGAVDFYLLAQNAKKGPVEDSDATAGAALQGATA